MQEHARQTRNNRFVESLFGPSVAVCRRVACDPRQVTAAHRSRTLASRRHKSSPFKFSARLPQTKGWAMKAHEFIDSGPPALLNNPCCCWRVVCCSFLKYPMEVQYG